MTLYFASLVSTIPLHSNSDFCYLFMFKPSLSKDYAYIKFGITEQQTLSKRFVNYQKDSIEPVNIFYISTTQVKNRESMMISLFNANSSIKKYKGREWFEGNYMLMVNIFVFVSLLSDQLIQTTLSNKQILQLFKQINTFKYTVNYVDNPIVYDPIDIELNIVSGTEENVIDDIDVDSDPNFTCNSCGRICKDKKGYTNHTNKCKFNNLTALICPACNIQCKNLYNIRKHMETCKVFKQNTETQKHEEKYTQYEDQLLELTTKNSELTKEVDQLNLLVESLQQSLEYKDNQLIDKTNRLNQIEEIVRIQVLQINQLKLECSAKSKDQKIKQLEDMINIQALHIKNIEIQNSSTSLSAKSILTFIPSFDASVFSLKFKAVNHFIYTCSQLIESLHRLGLGNMYRVVDRSRNIITWVKSDGTKIRDTNGVQLCEQLLKAIDGDLNYQVDILTQFNHKRENSPFYIDASRYTDGISLCNDLLNRVPSVITKLQKEICKHGKDKSDNTTYIPSGLIPL
jgi:hypothetical protein